VIVARLVQVHFQTVMHQLVCAHQEKQLNKQQRSAKGTINYWNLAPIVVVFQVIALVVTMAIFPMISDSVSAASVTVLVPKVALQRMVFVCVVMDLVERHATNVPKVIMDSQIVKAV
jgi:hypothetical protein